MKVAGETVGTALRALETVAAGIGSRLFDEQGNLKRYVNVFLNDEDVRFASGLDTVVKDGDVISIVPAIAGG